MSSFEDPEIEAAINEIGQSFIQDQQKALHDDVVPFRADVLSKMQRAGATTDRSWMLFRTLEPPGPYSNLPDPIPTDTLVTKYFPVIDKAEKLILPSIRIFRTERIHTRRGIEYLVQDVTVDNDGDSQFFIDLIFHEQALYGGGDTKEPDPVDLDPNLDRSPKLPLPVIQNGKLTFSYRKPNHITPFSKLFSIGDNNNEGVIPFGLYNNLWDQKYAILKATEFFGHIAHLEPEEIGELQPFA